MNSPRRPSKRDHAIILRSSLNPSGLEFDAEQSLRHGAIYELARVLPNDDFQILDERMGDVSWFLPDHFNLGKVQPFPTDAGGQQARVLYLSPALEYKDPRLVLAVVAHELAHVFLGHPVLGSTTSEYDFNEEQAWDQVRAWGFEKEVEISDAYTHYRNLLEQDFDDDCAPCDAKQ